jgi:four helix bundle protein
MELVVAVCRIWIDADFAEGHIRRSLREYLHFLSTARTSLAEVETYLDLLPLIGYASHEQTQPVLNIAASVSRQLVVLRDSFSICLQEEPFPYDTIP